MQLSILIVSNFFPPEIVGGAEIVAHRQAFGLRALGYKVAVFTAGLPREGFEPGSLELESADGIPVYRLALRSQSPQDNFHWPASARRFLAVFNACQPQIVHFHNVMGLGANLIPLAKAQRARVVVTLHDHWGFCFKNTLLRNNDTVCRDAEECGTCLPAIPSSQGVSLPIRLRRDYISICLQQADVLLSPSVYLSRAYEESQAVRRRVQVLSNGIQTREIRPSVPGGSKPVRFVAFGYLGLHKGFPVLLKAAERLARQAEFSGRWSLTIAGHGELGPAIERDIASNRFAGAVHLAGRLPHDEALDLMARSDVVVLASIWPENEPVTLLEAIASGKAQIASRIGGNVEVVEHGVSGLLFEPGDDEDLASAMRTMIEEPAMVAACGAHNAARRCAFDEQHTLAALDAILREEPSAPTGCQDLMVLCVGNAPAENIGLLAEHLHWAEGGPRRIRLVWHEWADTQMWRSANLVWFWGKSEEADIRIVAQALRFGIPVLAPDGGLAAELAGRFGVKYDTLLDAIGWIAALLDGPEPSQHLREQATVSAARLVTAMAPRASFVMSVED